MTKELLKTLLNHEFYDKYKTKITDSLFPEKHIRSLYRTLDQAHKNTSVDLSIEELRALHYTYNPAITTAAKLSLDGVFEELSKVNISSAVGEETLRQAIRNTAFTEAATLCLDAADNKAVDIQKIKDIIASADTDLNSDEFEEVSTDLDFLLAEDQGHFKWKYHHPGLRAALDGIGSGIFTLVAARPNAGKTAFMVSNIFHPEGWIAQGAHVVLVSNEESATRTMLRGFSAYTGMTRDEIAADPNKARELFAPARPYIHTVGKKELKIMSVTQLEKFIRTRSDYKADIIIIDQIDKMSIEGTFASETERIRKLYTYVRDMTVEYEIPIIGVCQASDSAEGKLYFGFDALENSRTGKGAEVDVCICIGKESFTSNQGNDTGFRVANLAKNKPTGKEIPVPYMLQPQLSRIDV